MVKRPAGAPTATCEGARAPQAMKLDLSFIIYPLYFTLPPGDYSASH
jgi:hypothetical protein